VSYTVDEAATIGEALKNAAVGNPCRQLRYEFSKRAREWLRAAEELSAADDPDSEIEATIELVSAVANAMQIPGDSPTGWLTVVRTMARDGQFSMQLENPKSPQPVWRNFYGPSSPCVVRA